MDFNKKLENVLEILSLEGLNTLPITSDDDLESASKKEEKTAHKTTEYPACNS